MSHINVTPLKLLALPAHEWDRGSCVYFLGCGNFVKIGWTTCLSARVKTLATANPLTLEVLAVFDGDMNLERRFHEFFAEHRARLEWFERKGSLDAFLSSSTVTLARELRQSPQYVEDFAPQYRWLEERLRLRGDDQLADLISQYAGFVAEQEVRELTTDPPVGKFS